MICGGGLINSLIDKLPVELHIPGGYQYCGPGTKLEKRLRRGDTGINKLDQACKEHDIAYSKYSDLEHRHQADKVLGERAWDRVKSKDAGFREKAAALAVSTTMKTKRKLGMGLNRGGRRDTGVQRKKPQKSAQHDKRGKIIGKTRVDGVRKPHREKSGGGVQGKVVIKGGFLKNVIAAVKDATRSANTGTAKNMIKIALAAAKKIVKSNGGNKNINLPRIIPIPKEGGFLPFLIPLFAGLSATGALAGGISGITKAINAASEAKKLQSESERHNKTMEAIALGKNGNALYLRPYRTGSALFLNSHSKN